MESRGANWKLKLLLPFGVVLLSAVCMVSWARWDLSKYEKHHSLMINHIDSEDFNLKNSSEKISYLRDVELIGIGIKDTKRVVLQMQSLLGIIIIMFSVFVGLLFGKLRFV